jgi:hypothetical protein
MELLPLSRSGFAGNALEGGWVGLHIHDLAGGPIPLGPLSAWGLELTSAANGAFTVAVVAILVCCHLSPASRALPAPMRNDVICGVTRV